MPAATPFRAGRAKSSAAAGFAGVSFNGNYVLLADCSEFQPEITDALYLSWSRAIVIRALYGDARDDGAWYGGQRRADLHAGGAEFLGIYAYLVAGQDGAAQAQAFRALVGPVQPGEVFIADFEEGARPALTAWYNEMITLYGPGIAPYLWTYTGLDFGEAQGVLPVQWLADYTGTEPSSPAHVLWQFTDAYAIPGVGTADCSVFRGTIARLAALAYGAAAPAVVPVAEPEISQGATGAAVVTAQQRLNVWGAIPRLVTDGNFGPATLAAVQAFQHAHGLTADGVIGPATWARLEASPG
jgi:Putative peptidoglycan binding domain